MKLHEKKAFEALEKRLSTTVKVKDIMVYLELTEEDFELLETDPTNPRRWVRLKDIILNKFENISKLVEALETCKYTEQAKELREQIKKHNTTMFFNAASKVRLQVAKELAQKKAEEAAAAKEEAAMEIERMKEEQEEDSKPKNEGTQEVTECSTPADAEKPATEEVQKDPDVKDTAEDQHVGAVCEDQLQPPELSDEAGDARESSQTEAGEKQIHPTEKNIEKIAEEKIEVKSDDVQKKADEESTEQSAPDQGQPGQSIQKKKSMIRRIGFGKSKEKQGQLQETPEPEMAENPKEDKSENPKEEKTKSAEPQEEDDGDQAQKTPQKKSIRQRVGLGRSKSQKSSDGDGEKQPEVDTEFQEGSGLDLTKFRARDQEGQVSVVLDAVSLEDASGKEILKERSSRMSLVPGMVYETFDKHESWTYEGNGNHIDKFFNIVFYNMEEQDYYNTAFVCITGQVPEIPTYISPTIEGLTTLTLSVQYQLTEESVGNLGAFFTHLFKCLPGLKVFKFNGGGSQLDGIGRLFSEMGTVCWLTIQDVGMSGDDTLHLVESINKTNIHTITIIPTDKTIDSMVELIERLKDCPKLSSLCMDRFNISSQSAGRFFGALQGWPNLQKIKLISGGLSAKGEDKLFELVEVMQSLKKVSVKSEFELVRKSELSKKCKQKKISIN